MTIKVIRKADRVAAVPERWQQQYPTDYRGWNPEGKHAITRRLKALPKGFTATEVDEIIGNKSWTECRCDECGLDSDVLVRIGEDRDYDTRFVDVCATCLSRAVTAAGAA